MWTGVVDANSGIKRRQFDGHSHPEEFQPHVQQVCTAFSYTKTSLKCIFFTRHEVKVHIGTTIKCLAIILSENVGFVCIWILNLLVFFFPLLLSALVLKLIIDMIVSKVGFGRSSLVPKVKTTCDGSHCYSTGYAAALCATPVRPAYLCLCPLVCLRAPAWMGRGWDLSCVRSWLWGSRGRRVVCRNESIYSLRLGRTTSQVWVKCWNLSWNERNIKFIVVILNQDQLCASQEGHISDYIYPPPPNTLF